MGTGFHGGFGDTYGARENHKRCIKKAKGMDCTANILPKDCCHVADIKRSETDCAEDALPEGAPIDIPSFATVKEEQKNGYDQVKYTWREGDYTYTCRWHTRTPNAPKEQGDSWVVERKKSGIGFGKNARPKHEEVLVGKDEWISKQDWNDAIMARKKGTLTQKQKEWLDNGHWKK